MLFSAVLVGIFCIDVWLAAAMCPFKRATEAEGAASNFDFDPEELARLHKKSRSEPHEHERRSSTFDPLAQKVSVSGENAWAPPGPGDTRGPCPGLNALANHGYLPRNGVTGFLQAATACQQVYGLGLDGGTLLSLYSTLVSGDPITQTWSIGGPPPPVLGLPILGSGNGLSGSHNKYEADASATRGDYYLYNGDVSTLRIDKFQALYDIAKNDATPNYDLGVITKHRNYTLNLSRSTNPYFFQPPFGSFVPSVAHLFIPALMSNHSVEYPNGILSKMTLKSFFAVSESSDGTLSYTPGHERIPNNWYRRPLGIANDYSLLSIAGDLVTMAQTVPGVIAVGGNTGTVNSFTGVDLSDITGGVYRTADLVDPSKLVCYIYQITLAVVPDILRSRFLGSILGTALNLLSDVLTPFTDPECAKIANYNDDFAAQFPGAALGN